MLSTDRFQYKENQFINLRQQALQDLRKKDPFFLQMSSALSAAYAQLTETIIFGVDYLINRRLVVEKCAIGGALRFDQTAEIIVLVDTYLGKLRIRSD